MKKLTVVCVFVLLATAVLSVAVVQAAPSDNACWGQATKVFAQMGAMGDHASGYDTPRYGLRNLARAPYMSRATSPTTRCRRWVRLWPRRWAWRSTRACRAVDEPKRERTWHRGTPWKRGCAPMPVYPHYANHHHPTTRA